MHYINFETNMVLSRISVGHMFLDVRDKVLIEIGRGTFKYTLATIIYENENIETTISLPYSKDETRYSEPSFVLYSCIRVVFTRKIFKHLGNMDRTTVWVKFMKNIFKSSEPKISFTLKKFNYQNNGSVCALYLLHDIQCMWYVCVSEDSSLSEKNSNYERYSVWNILNMWFPA